MVDNNDHSHDPDYPYPKIEPEIRFSSQLIGCGILGILMLWGLCSQLTEPKDFWTVFVGGVLSYLILLAMVHQSRIYNKQWIAMREGLERTDNLLEQNQEVIAVMHAQREISAQQAIIALRQVEKTDRPWLTADVRFKSGLQFSKDGAKLGFILAATNVGKSVAVNAVIEAKLMVPTIGNNMLYQSVADEHRRLYEGITDRFMSSMVFPGQQIILDITFTLSPNEIQKGLASDSDLFFMCIVGCVDYQISGHEGRHQTRFVYEIQRVSEDGPHIPLIMKLGEDVPQERLILRKPILGARDYAD